MRNDYVFEAPTNPLQAVVMAIWLVLRGLKARRSPTGRYVLVSRECW